MSDPAAPPVPLRLALTVPVRVTCSSCDRFAEIQRLPLEVATVGAPPTVDRRELARLLPEDWKVGAIRVARGVLVDPRAPASSLVDVPDPFPVAFCSRCVAERTPR